MKKEKATNIIYILPQYEVFASEYPPLNLCRVILQEKGQYRIIGKSGEQPAQVSGKFRYDVKTISTTLPSEIMLWSIQTPAMRR